MTATRTTRRDEAAAWAALDTVMDPEIPVLSLVELKVVRAVTVQGDRVRLVMSPTFAGCPAFEVMKREARAALQATGFREVTIEETLSPPWSTEMLDEPAREKLRAFGLAPPARHTGDPVATLQEPLVCPHCGSTNTRLDTPFGSTLCKMLGICDNCRQPFEAFKAL